MGVNTVVTGLICTVASMMVWAFAAWIVRPHRRRKLTDPEDYQRRSQYPARRAADELAERDEAIAQAWRDWS